MNQVVQITGPATQAEKGWLKPMFPITGKAHYFNLDLELPATATECRAYYWIALCGVDAASTEKVPMFDAGNWSRCKKCERAISRSEPV